MTRLGYQIPNFTYPGVAADQLFPTVVAQAQEAENSGFDTVFVMDHFYQLPMLGEPDDPSRRRERQVGQGPRRVDVPGTEPGKTVRVPGPHLPGRPRTIVLPGEVHRDHVLAARAAEVALGWPHRPMLARPRGRGSAATCPQRRGS